MHCVFVFLITFSMMPFAMAQESDALKKDLRTLSQKIQYAQGQMNKIDEKLSELALTKEEAQEKVNKDRYRLSKNLSAQHNLQQKPLYLSFLTQKSSILDRYYDYRTNLTHQKIIQRNTERSIQRLTDIQSKIETIERYKHEQTLLALTVEESLNQLDTLSEKQNAAYSLQEFALIVDDLKNKHSTLNDLIQSLVTLDEMEPVRVKEFSFILPLSGVVTDGTKAHSGISITSKPRALVSAPESGRIIYAAPFKRWGEVIIINHGQGYVSMLRGFDRIFVQTGQQVSQNDPLGITAQKSGTTTNGAMLYYELRYNGKVINPLTLLSGIEN